MLAAREFVEQEPQGVEVGATVEIARLARELLGGRVVERPHERARLTRAHCLVLQPPDAQVHHSHGAVEQIHGHTQPRR